VRRLQSCLFACNPHRSYHQLIAVFLQQCYR